MKTTESLSGNSFPIETSKYQNFTMKAGFPVVLVIGLVSFGALTSPETPTVVVPIVSNSVTQSLSPMPASGISVQTFVLLAECSVKFQPADPSAASTSNNVQSDPSWDCSCKTSLETFDIHKDPGRMLWRDKWLAQIGAGRFIYCYTYFMNIIVIGGTGGMGATLIQFFNSHQHSARAIGRKTKNPGPLLNQADVIVLSVPSTALTYAVNLLKEIDINKKLIVSLGSCMLHDKKVLKALKVPLLHIHQLFGPQVYPYNGHKIVLSGALSHPCAKKIKSALVASDVDVLVMTEAKHDQVMANVQAMSQFSTISMAKTLSESGISQKDLMKASTITFKMNAGLMKRIAEQKSALWATLQFENESAGKVLDKYLRNVIDIRKMAKKKDYKGFEKMFIKVAKYWK